MTGREAIHRALKAAVEATAQLESIDFTDSTNNNNNNNNNNNSHGDGTAAVNDGLEAVKANHSKAHADILKALRQCHRQHGSSEV